MLDITFSESELGWIELTESKAFCIISNSQGQGMLFLKLLFLIQEGNSNFQNDMKSLLKTQTTNELSFFSRTLQQIFVNNKESEKKRNIENLRWFEAGWFKETYNYGSRFWFIRFQLNFVSLQSKDVGSD